MDAFTRPDPIRLEASPERLVVIPGGQTALNVAVTNRDDVAADFDLILSGVPNHWTGGPLALINVLSKGLRDANDRIADLTRSKPKELHKLYDAFG